MGWWGNNTKQIKPPPPLYTLYIDNKLFRDQTILQTDYFSISVVYSPRGFIFFFKGIEPGILTNVQIISREKKNINRSPMKAKDLNFHNKFTFSTVNNRWNLHL